MPTEAIPIDSNARRALLFGVAAVLITGTFFTAKWGFANTVATRTDVKELAEFGTGLASGDPYAHFSNAGILDRTFDPDSIARALSEYETAVSLSPNNYLFWLGLGRARERDGDRPAAERAFRHAAKLAPNYARVKWALGNVLVRQDKTEEGFAEMRSAVESDTAFAAPAVTAAWQVFDGDLDRVKTALGDSPPIYVELAKFLAGQKRFDDAAAVWGKIPKQEKRSTYHDAGKALTAKFIEGKRYRLAVTIAGEIAEDASNAPATAKFVNGDFEKGLKAQNADLFDWQLGSGEYPQIGPSESQNKQGKVSLIILFRVPANTEFRPVQQTLAVEPGKKYRLALSYRMETKTNAVFRWEVVSAGDGKRLSVTDPLVNATAWSTEGTEFLVPADVDGITIRLIRENCVSPSCSVSGNIWFDDFVLSSVN